jgi:hypothetical protein
MEVARFSKDGAKSVKTNICRKETNASGKMRRIVRAKRLMDGTKKPTDGEQRLINGARRPGDVAKRQIDGVENRWTELRDQKIDQETNGRSTGSNGWS